MTMLDTFVRWMAGTSKAEANAKAYFDVASRLQNELNRLNRDFDAARNSAARRRAELIQSQQQVNAMRDTLRRIAACETPGANATVRRMAKMAREARE